MSKRQTMIAIVSVLMLGYFVGSCTPTEPGGATGPGGVTLDAKLVSNPARIDLAGTGLWEPLPSATATFEVTTGPASLLANFWASTACFGAGRKNVRILLDGTQVATGMLAAWPSTVTTQSEISTTVQGSKAVTTGTHTVSVEVRIDTGSGCAITSDLWHLDAELLAV